MPAEPVVSAVVTLRPRGAAGGEGAGGQEQPRPPDDRTLATVKGHFTSAGFEVHAPFPTSFSILGARSLFERVFGAEVVIDESSLAQSVTTANGERELPLAGLPDQIRDVVDTVAFMPPPDLGGLAESATPT